MPPPLDAATDSQGQAGLVAPWEPGADVGLGWLSDELADQYRNYVSRLHRATVLLGAPADDETRRRCDERVWRYLVWLDGRDDVEDPFADETARQATLERYAEQLRSVEGLDRADLDGELAIVWEMHRRIRHGGNRLGPDHPYRPWTPTYERCREMPADPERRDNNQRRRTEIAADVALSRGELNRSERTALRVLLSHTNDTCKTWIIVSQATLGREAGGYAERTAREWLANLHRKGWIHKVHRCRRVVDENGSHLEGETLLVRVVIPEQLRKERYKREDPARAKGSATRQAAPAVPRPGDRSGQPSGGRRPRTPRPGPARMNDRRKAIRQGLECPDCKGIGWIEDRDGRVAYCGACKGHGLVAAGRAPP